MKRGFIFILMTVCICSSFGQDNRERRIYGQLVDYVTRKELNNAKVTLMTTDSAVVDTSRTWYEYTPKYNCYSIPVKTEGKYILLAESEGYEPQFFPIDIKFHRRETYIYLPQMTMKRKQKVHKIDEVVVTATKVKFYHKDDTLVYNADAFQLAEGSMLDALIKQLPGAELKSDGRIYVNGRFVESLLLNGKDFFKGDNTIMLENLPTYAVNTVKVYEKTGEFSKFIGKDIINDKQFVMDVNLKKQYNIGWMGNVDAGGANHDMYMARLFAMRSTDHSRLSFYGNINNLNDFTTPSTSDWTPDKMPYGRLTTKSFGVNLNIDDREKRFTYAGNANYSRYDNHVIQNTFTTNFLSGGNTYDRHVQDADLSNTFVNTNHTLYLTPGGDDARVSIDIRQGASYTDRKQELDILSATSEETWNGFNDFISVLSVPVLSDELRNRLINRQIQNSYYRIKTWDTYLTADMKIKIPHCEDALGFKVSGSLNGGDYNYFDRKQIDFFRENPASTDFINRFKDGTPSRGYSYNIEANYHYSLGQSDYLTFIYGFNQDYINTKESLYRLEQIDGWGVGTEHPIGTLPSVREYLPSLDAGNSYRGALIENAHTLTVGYTLKVYDNKKSRMYFTPALIARVKRERLKYQRAELDTAFARTNILVTPSFTMKWNTKDWKEDIRFDYKMDMSTPNMLYCVSFVQDSDPMVTTNYGNRNLKNRQSHSFSISYNNTRNILNFRPSAGFNVSRNDVAMGYVYDRATGRREYSFYNVNGNWNMYLNMNANGTLDKKKRLTFSSATAWNYYNSVDMIGDDLASAPVKSTVRTSVLSENVNFSYSLGKHSIGVKGSFAWTNSSGDRDDFTTINAYNYNYGMTGTVSLPWKFVLETDFTVYSRRGYEESDMNDDNFVWNARLTRSFFKGKLTLRADAFDILHQLKKVERSINTQGRVERFYNTPPRYVLLHAIYRFNVFPKKKM